jgi:hypothetical protein
MGSGFEVAAGSSENVPYTGLDDGNTVPSGCGTPSEQEEGIVLENCK